MGSPVPQVSTTLLSQQPRRVSRMSIGTWNIERMGRGQKFGESYQKELEKLKADVVVVTEPALVFTISFLKP